jgi:hypothetical protein
MPTAVAIYDNSTDLQRALDRLHEAGFGEDSIRVIGQGDATTAGTDESRTGEAGAGFGDNADEGLAGMAAAGGLGRGTTAGGAGAFAAPGGSSGTPLLMGAAGGAFDSLQGLDISEDEARFFSQSLGKEGSQLLAVTAAGEDAARVYDIFRQTRASQSNDPNRG